ncbi:MAG: hypothetical protein A2Y40_03655 [Candidatus Margulisbacteria bacterium GWF2_35_9]|nr:MAG: hypothetical protein A2Y40_03655 [Candidatus Margulisbacteria bacterium GWF2_35_9]
MSGHSKWSTIKRKKGANDEKKGKIFTKAAREVIMAARLGGGDPDMNSRLRFAIQKAKEVNMPNDNIKKAILRGTGSGDSGHMEEVTYEAYAQAGVAMIIECVTDNKNRTLPEIKNVITKAGGNMAEKGSVAYMFSKKGVFVFDGAAVSEDKIMDIAINHDVDDIKQLDDGSIEVICESLTYESLKNDFDSNNIAYLNSELSMIPSMQIPVTDVTIAKKILSMIDKLEDNDDVQNVYSNSDISDETYQQLEDENS